MMKEKTKSVNNWEELTRFVESINPYKKTLVLTGWVNEIVGEKTSIKTLVFSTKNVEILKEENEETTPLSH